MSLPTAPSRVRPHAPTRVFVPYDADDETLADCVGPDRHLRAICRCGAISAFDPQAWVQRGLGFAAMATFAGRLRCVCGRRSARFEVWPGTAAESGLKLTRAASLYD